MTQVLSLALRPQTIDAVIGNTTVTAAIKAQLAGRIPVGIWLSGDPGCGKTTLSKIIARMVNVGIEESQLDIQEINGQSENGIDKVRELIEQSKYRPFSGRRVVIVNEAHGLTSASKNALLDPLESKNESTLWIFTSMSDRMDKDEKLDKALRRRLTHYALKPMTELEVRALVQRASENTSAQLDTTSFITLMVKSKIGSAGEILAAWELYASGIPLASCITSAAHNSDYRDIASAVLRGDWDKTRGLLAGIPNADSRGLRSMVSGYLRSALLKTEAGAKADALAVCLVGLGSVQFEDGVAFGVLCGLLQKTCRQMGGR
jgi:replication-associated recombination protein RarA